MENVLLNARKRKYEKDRNLKNMAYHSITKIRLYLYNWRQASKFRISVLQHFSPYFRKVKNNGVNIIK